MTPIFTYCDVKQKLPIIPLEAADGFCFLRWKSPECLARFRFCRQSQLAKMTSDLCEDGGDEQREKEAPAASKASSVSPLSAVTSLELPGPWSSPLSPVTALAN